jgi:hypothetical protein
MRIHWIALLLLGLPGCRDHTPTPHPTAAEKQNSQSERRMSISERPDEIEQTDTSPRKLAISKFHDGDWVRLGVLSFDERNQATLSFEGSGPMYDQLEQDWYTISDEPELLWKRSVPHEKDGETVTRSEGVKVRPDDERYIYAVFNTLERSYGYRVKFGK